MNFSLYFVAQFGVTAYLTFNSLHGILQAKKKNCKGGLYHVKKASSLFQSISFKFHSRISSRSQNSPLKLETVVCW